MSIYLRFSITAIQFDIWDNISEFHYENEVYKQNYIEDELIEYENSSGDYWLKGDSITECPYATFVIDIIESEINKDRFKHGWVIFGLYVTLGVNKIKVGHHVFYGHGYGSFDYGYETCEVTEPLEKESIQSINKLNYKSKTWYNKYASKRNLSYSNNIIKNFFNRRKYKKRHVYTI